MSWFGRYWRQINLTASVCMIVLACFSSNTDSVLPSVCWLINAIELMRPRL